MYKVSDGYKKAMRQPVHRFRMTGTVAGTAFTEKNILEGSFSITNQCSDENEVKIGQVYIGELDVTLIGTGIKRYSLKDKEIKPVFGRLVSGKYEDVPLGVYTVSEAGWTASGIVIKAYDNMAKFDKTCTIDSANGTTYDLAKMACKACGVELGTTEEEFLKFANGGVRLSLYNENDIETWRDFLSWVAQTCACFATCDRAGKIIFREYGQSVVDTINPQNRFTGGSFSDFETRYTGMSVVDMRDQKTIYYGMDIDDALTYNLGSNPFLQYGTDIDDIRQAVLNHMQGIKYVPYKVSMIGDPVYDLGDVFSFPEGLADGEKLFCLTKYTFTYNGSLEIQGVGKNPALASAKSKTDKNIAGLLNRMEDDTMHFATYTNTEDAKVGDGATGTLAFMRFVTSKTTHVAFDMELMLAIETTESGTEWDWTIDDAEVTFTYLLDGDELKIRHPVETWQDGAHLIHLRYDVTSVETAIHTWEIKATVKGGNVTIEPYGAYIVAMGRGVVGDGAEWDGFLDVSDYFTPITLDSLPAVKTNRMQDKLTSLAVTVPIPKGIEETIGTISIATPKVTVCGMTGSVETGFKSI